SQTVGRPRSSSLSRGLLMAKLTLSQAARACGVARTTIQRAVKTGRLSLDAEHLVDTAELLRVGYEVDAAMLHAAAQQAPRQTPQNAAPSYSTPAAQRCCVSGIPAHTPGTGLLAAGAQ